MFRLKEKKETHLFKFDSEKSRNMSPLLTSGICDILKNNALSIKLSYTDSGAKNKPVLVMLHGNSSNKKVFNAQKQHFESNYRVLSLDLLGHGASTMISDFEMLPLSEREALAAAFYNPLAMIALITDWLESLSIEKAHLIGWSLGGHFAYGIAVLNPELVGSIITIGSPPVKFSQDGFLKGFNPWFVKTLVPAWVAQPTKYTMKDAMDIAVHMGFTGQVDLVTCATAMQQTDPLVRRHLFLSLSAYDGSGYDASPLDGEYFIANTTIPVTLLVGGKDAGINADFYAGMAEKMQHPSSKVKLIEDGAHAVFSTNPAEYYHVIDTFLDEVAQSSFTKTHQC